MRYCPLKERFWPKVAIGKQDECWNWIACLSSSGYGFISGEHSGPMVAAHRVAWELTNGPIPDGMHVLHHCDNPRCCNPAHLRIGTNADNVADKMARKRLNPVRGTRHKNSKLVDTDIPIIRALYGAGVSVPAIAKRFNVVDGTIHFILNGRNWSHIP